MIKLLALFSVLLLCSGCHGPADHREEAQAIVLQISSLLEEVENGEQLTSKTADLKRLFNLLADQMIVVANQSSTNPFGFSQAEKDASEHLRMQLNRVCSFNGGYEVIEKCQEEALHRLTTFSLKTKTG